MDSGKPLMVDSQIMNTENDDQYDPSRVNQTPFRRTLRGQARRIDLRSYLLLSIGTLVLLGVIAFLTFLWFANEKSSVWHRIAINGFMARSVTISTLILRAIVALQTTVIASMLSGLSLEMLGVRAKDLASVSTSRSGNNSLIDLVSITTLSFFKGKVSLKRAAPAVALLLLFCLGIISQFASTLLVSDLEISTIPGVSERTTMMTDLNERNSTIKRPSTWTYNPSNYFTFAEHAEPILNSQEDDGFIDTGVVMRAFLPFQNASIRTNLQSYHGRTTVLDARVVCVRPDLSNVMLNTDTTDNPHNPVSGKQTWLLTGTAKPAMAPSSLHLNTTSNSKKQSFGCFAYMGGDAFSRLSMCQVYQDSGLRSAFTDLLGPSYLMVQVTSGSANEWNLTAGVGSSNESYSISPQKQSERGEWLDLIFSTDRQTVMSVSLCFPAFDSQGLVIQAKSNSVRTEPQPGFAHSLYTFDGLRHQLGQSNDGNFTYPAPATRGLLSLQPRSWKNQTGDLIVNLVRTGGWDKSLEAWTRAWILLRCRLDGPLNNDLPSPNYTAPLNIFEIPSTNLNLGLNLIYADPAYSSLAQEILTAGGSIAHLLQSLITVAASSVYYDHLPQFTIGSPVTQTSFNQVLVPVRYRGYLAILCVTILHLLLCMLVVVWFLVSSTVSSVGNVWQTVAQLASHEGLWEIVRQGTVATDKEIEKSMIETNRLQGRLDLRPDDIVRVQLDDLGSGAKVVVSNRSFRST